MADALVYGSLFALMSIGLTLTYMTTRVPNFAQGSFVTVGAYLAFSMYHFRGVPPYGSLPFSFLLVGGVATAMYKLILKPLSARGSSLISLMIATLAIDIGFVGIFGIYSDLLSNVYRVYDSKFFLLSNTDFTILGTSALIFIAPLSLALITVFLWLGLTQTKFGIAMRTTVENPNLAGILGINVEARVYGFMVSGRRLSGSGWLTGCIVAARERTHWVRLHSRHFCRKHSRRTLQRLRGGSRGTSSGFW